MSAAANSVPYIGSQSGDVPKDIKFKCHAVAFDFHPSKDILAAGLIDGPVKIWSYSLDKLHENHKLMSFNYYKKSCRAVHFSSSGETLFTGSSDKTAHVLDLNEGAIVHRLVAPDGAAIYSMLPIDNYLLATGDDDGQIVIWDFRRASSIMNVNVCEEYVSHLEVGTDKRTLLATSGGGMFSVLNLRSRKIECQSSLNDELLTIAIMKQQTKVLIGDCSGGLNISNWGDWEKWDKFSGHPVSLNSMVTVNDDLVCIGCENGEIQAVEIHPNRVIGVLARHDDFPVEALCISHDEKFIASSSYDGKIKFHDFSSLTDLDLDEIPKQGKAGCSSKNSFLSNMT